MHNKIASFSIQYNQHTQTFRVFPAPMANTHRTQNTTHHRALSLQFVQPSPISPTRSTLSHMSEATTIRLSPSAQPTTQAPSHGLTPSPADSPILSRVSKHAPRRRNSFTRPLNGKLAHHLSVGVLLTTVSRASALDNLSLCESVADATNPWLITRVWMVSLTLWKPMPRGRWHTGRGRRTCAGRATPRWAAGPRWGSRSSAARA